MTGQANIDAPPPSGEQESMACKGVNCKALNGVGHSAECRAEHNFNIMAEGIENPHDRRTSANSHTQFENDRAAALAYTHPAPPPSGEREALIAWHRAMQEVCRDSDGTAFLNHRDTADMLAADAPKGNPTDAEIDGLWLCCSLIPGKQKEQVRDFARVLLTSYAAPGNANGIERLQAELDRLTQQKPDAWELAEKVWKDLDRQSCPGIYMQIATESIVKHCATPPAPPARELSNDLADDRLDEMVAMAVWEEEP